MNFQPIDIRKLPENSWCHGCEGGLLGESHPAYTLCAKHLGGLEPGRGTRWRCARCRRLFYMDELKTHGRFYNADTGRTGARRWAGAFAFGLCEPCESVVTASGLDFREVEFCDLCRSPTSYAGWKRPFLCLGCRARVKGKCTDCGWPLWNGICTGSLRPRSLELVAACAVARVGTGPVAAVAPPRRQRRLISL